MTSKKTCELYREWLVEGCPEPFLEWAHTRRNEDKNKENKTGNDRNKGLT